MCKDVYDVVLNALDPYYIKELIHIIAKYLAIKSSICLKHGF